MHSHTGCIMTSSHCVSSNVSSNHLLLTMQSDIGCICKTFLHCVFSNESLNGLPEKMHNHTPIAFVWLFPIVYFQMRSQVACLRWCKVTLVAFVWLFPTVYSQLFMRAIWRHIQKFTVEKNQANATNMNLHPLSQATWRHIWKVAQVAFVQLLSTMRFQMIP